MNKYQKALSFFFKIATPRYLKVTTSNFNKKYSDNLSILSSLIEKATPKKPTEKLIEVYCGEIPSEKELHYYCECGEWVGDEMNRQHYCCSCGQAIDWSDEND